MHRQAHEILAAFRGHRSLKARLARRWLLADMDAELDILLRLGVLERLAGVPFGTWWRKGRAGLDRARATFEDLPYDLHPAWLDTEDSGLYRTTKRLVQKMLNKQEVSSLSAEDLMHEAIIGLGDTGNPVNVPVTWTLARSYEPTIRRGAPPIKFVKVLARWIGGDRMKMDWRQENYGRMQDFPEPEIEPPDFGEIISDLVFHNMRNPLSVKLRNLMRRTWEDSVPMTIWLDIVENERRFPMGKEVAELSGVAASAFTARHWKPRWRKFFQALWARPGLIEQVAEYAKSLSYDWNPRQPSDAEMDILLKPRSDRPRP